MITTRGKQFFKRYLANQAGQVAGAVSFGIGPLAANVNDTRLQFEFARAPLSLVTYDFVNDLLIFKGSLTENTGGVITEVGLWTSENSSTNVNEQSRIITTFDSVSEAWDVETFDSTNTRIGADSLKHTPAASATSTSILAGLSMDLIDNTSQDSFILAFQVDNAFVANIKIRLRTDASNYYEYTVTSPGVGLNFATFLKGSATVVGSPDWADINELSVSTTATSGGAASVEYEGLRIEDTDVYNQDYGLIARFIPTTPVTKTEGLILDFEYSLAVTI